MKNHEVVAMHGFIQIVIAEQGLDLRALATGDASQVVRGVSRQPPGDLVSRRVDDGYTVSSTELTFDSADPGREKTPTLLLQGRGSPGVDLDSTESGSREGDPVLALGDPGRGRSHPGSPHPRR